MKVMGVCEGLEDLKQEEDTLNVKVMLNCHTG